MDVLDNARDVTPGVCPERRVGRPRWVNAVVAVALLCGGLFAAAVWYRGGSHLLLDGGGLGIHPAPVGMPVSFGVGMTVTNGSTVVLEAARADHTSDVNLQFAIARTGPGEVGIGTLNGTNAGSLPVSGARVVQPEGHPDRGATWLVVTVMARRPGPWTVTHIAITYRSGWRTRTTVSGYHVQGMAPPA